MSGRTRIKICGMTDQNEAAHAITCGVDALGFIFFQKSPRNIDPDRARNIIKTFPPFVDAVGVFVNEDPEVVAEIVKYCRLTTVQLHGSESPEYCQQIPCRIVKAFQVAPSMTPDDLSAYDDVVSGFLLDTYHKEIKGGTGETFDWSRVAKLRPKKPVILAGGITPDNAAEAIHQVTPYGIDANSGLETAPGRKDIDKITRFIQTVRLTDG
ncbi:MAG: phosphoribosylanthranilate isomerase [Desulfobulbaceae bacterium]|nr:phosphoribosylanthranilate isomerase [Desulfobulbaceae bacterium]